MQHLCCMGSCFSIIIKRCVRKSQTHRQNTKPVPQGTNSIYLFDAIVVFGNIQRSQDVRMFFLIL